MGLNLVDGWIVGVVVVKPILRFKNDLTILEMILLK
jgi:hypothetical protein